MQAPTPARGPAPATTGPSAKAAPAPALRDAPDAGATVAVARKAPPSTRVRRRRRGIWLALAVVLVAAGAGAFLLLGGTGKTTVPPLQGLHRPSVLARTGHAHVDAVFVSHYSHAPVGVAIAQIPDPGTRVKQGSKVRVLMSSGPPPVAVPSAVGEPLGEAEEAIAGAGLRYALHTVPAPGHTAESVLSESPSAAASVPSGSTVTLTVVAAPQWRPLTTFSGKDAGQSVPFSIRGHRWRLAYTMSYVHTCLLRSVPFSIRGHRWRLAYTMSYVHTCLLLVVCEGPSATVENLSTASSFGEFELDEGGGTHYRVFDSGPGLYRVAVTGGQDSARWSATVEDFY